MRVITGLDLPLGAPGGSVELLKDLYLGASPRIASDVFMLATPDRNTVEPPGGPVLLSVDGKTLDGAGFHTYTDRLTLAVKARFGTEHYDVAHLQHLTFGATPALLRAFPDIPHVAIVHGTDLLFAETHPTQAEVLRSTVASARVVVVPTTAMADRLGRLADAPHVVHIPWGIDDALLASPPEPVPAASGQLRILYAGRLTGEKTTSSVLITLAAQPGVELSVAAPLHEYAELSTRCDLTAARYLGWFARPALWREFARQDLLIVPSVTLEAFGLVAVEAQACGLPVAYQAVPGLSEVLSDSALSVDFHSPGALAALVGRLRASPNLLDELREAGRANSARFPLSATAKALNDLSANLATRQNRRLGG
ncbi:glycosyltransferase family 4 protein [Longispora sp. NPDC051575]|uniref:glycosyltransferase family 4 protein n=1 Tax=Longispora sp. NPDC051575 TaxID=3154943 RepID=UPI00344AECBE